MVRTRSGKNGWTLILLSPEANYKKFSQHIPSMLFSWNAPKIILKKKLTPRSNTFVVS
jgi:hypothetical protein